MGVKGNNMKERALSYCDWMIKMLKEAINKGEAEPEQIKAWKDSGRMWKYIRKTIEEKGE